MTLPRPAAVPAAVLLAALAAGCTGDGGSSAAPGPETDAASGAFSRAEAEAGVADLFARLSPESADAAPCVGEALVADLPPDELEAAGLLAPDGSAPSQMPALDAATAGAWVDAWFGCVDYVQVTTRAQAKATRTLDAPAFRACLRDEVSGDEMRAAATDGLAGDLGSAAVDRLSRAQARCADRHS